VTAAVNTRIGARPGSGDVLLRALEEDDVLSGRLLAREIHRRIPDLGPAERASVLYNETLACCAAHVRQMARIAETGEPLTSVSVPDAGREFTVGLVRRRIGLPVLMRTYRIGQNVLWGMLSERLRLLTPAVGAQALDDATALLLDYIDRVSSSATEIYVGEQGRWHRSAAAVRADVVRDLLDGVAVDVDVASRRLGYELRRRHVAAVVASTSGRAVDAAVDDLAAQVGVTSLVVPSGTTEAWLWLAADGRDDEELAARLAAIPPRGLRIALGAVGDGREGFRTSHEEAQEARRMQELGGSSAAVLPYRRIELLSLLAADRDRAARFVARELGDLGRDDDGTEALRETVLAFLEHGGSHLATAAQLALHKNTVFSRIRRAEGVLGRPIMPGNAALHAALLLADGAVAMPAAEDRALAS